MNAAKDVCRLYLLASIIFSCGCAFTSSARYEFTQTLRARSAWRDFDEGLLFSRYSGDYARGWKAGFRSVLVGGDGRPPVVPPRRYWDPTIFRDCNLSKQQEWLQGFSKGAVAARQHNGQHYVRPFFSSGCGGTSCSPALGSRLPTPEPIQQIQTTPVTEFHEQDSSPACTIRLLGIEPIKDAQLDESEENSWAIPIPSDTKLPSETTTKELSPKPKSDNSFGDER